MGKKNNLTERRTALLTLINEFPGLSYQEICERVHHYREIDDDRSRVVQFHRDIDSLRYDGYMIVANNNRYFLEKDSYIDVSLNTLDAGLLASVLSSTSSNSPVAEVAHRGISKIIASTEASDDADKYLTARIPEGDAAIKLADAMQQEKRVSFLYDKSSSRTTYWLEPAFLHAHYGNFYISGYASKDCENWENRTFRVSRIDVDSVEIQGEAEFEPPTADDSYFTAHNIELAVRGKAVALATLLGETLREQSQWTYIAIDNIAWQNLYEFLAVQGRDVRIVSGPVKQWNKRVAHIVNTLDTAHTGSSEEEV